MARKVKWEKVGWFPVQFAFIPDEASWNKEVLPWMTKDPEWDPQWYSYPKHQPGRTCPINNGKDALRIAVTVSDDTDYKDWIDAFKTFVHEAIHVWQFASQFIGEDTIGPETEAYHIEGITDVLIRQYIKTRAPVETPVD